MLATSSITTFRCEECGKNFWPESGGRCVKCGRLLCSRHLFGWKFWRTSVGQPSACQRCLKADTDGKSSPPPHHEQEVAKLTQ